MKLPLADKNDGLFMTKHYLQKRNYTSVFVFAAAMAGILWIGYIAYNSLSNPLGKLEKAFQLGAQNLASPSGTKFASNANKSIDRASSKPTRCFHVKAREYYTIYNC